VYDWELLNSNLSFNKTEDDVSSLYMNDGYLFFQANPVEVLVENDSIDLEIRVYEGKQATINKVSVSGNTRTNDHVVVRLLRLLLNWVLNILPFMPFQLKIGTDQELK